MLPVYGFRLMNGRVTLIGSQFLIVIFVETGVIFGFRCDMAPRMRALLPFIACLMVVLTSWSGMTHAAEAAGGNFGAIAFTLHAQGDGDEVPADADKSVPHHHSVCHGQDVGTPVSEPSARLLGDAVVPLPLAHTGALAGTDGLVRLRPPQA